MRHYTITDLHYWEGLKNIVVSATQANSVTELPAVSKRLFLRNDGPNDVHLEFNKDIATVAGGFTLKAGDGLVRLRIQCAKIAAICAAGETASVRVGIGY